MDTKIESSFGETKNKSQADKHCIIRGDGTVSEPTFVVINSYMKYKIL